MVAALSTAVKRLVLTCPSFAAFEEEVFVSLLALIVWNNLDLANNAKVTHSLEFFGSSPLYNTLYILIDFEYWFKQTFLSNDFELGAVWHCSLTCNDFFWNSDRRLRKAICLSSFVMVRL